MQNGKTKNIGVFDHLKGQKSMILMICILVAGVFLLLQPNVKGDEVKVYDESRLNSYTDELEAKIEKICSGVYGVSNVNVSVYFDSGFETIYAYNEESKSSSSGTNSEKKYVTVGSGNDESMVCVLERMPSICGVAIVCKGGGNPRIANELINLISSAFGVPKNKIYVTEGKK